MSERRRDSVDCLVGPDAPYQEKCGHCGQWFWGIKDAPLCVRCSIKNDLWWRSLTEDQQLDHMKKQIKAIESSMPNNERSSLPWWRKDALGWPIETFTGKPVKSAIRIICQNIRKVICKEAAK